jgi:nitrogen fixation/metabolism regulation signal transduction histidine kinase
MVFILFSSIISTYTTIRTSQQAFDREVSSLEETFSQNSEILQKIALYEAFSAKQAVDTTRQLMFVLLGNILTMVIVFLIFIYGITRPIKKLSSAVKSIYFEKSKEELLLQESGTQEIRLLIRAFNQMVEKLKNYEKIVGNIQKYKGWKEISRIIVHEINNIISPIQTYIEFLNDRVNEKEKIILILAKLNDMREILQKFRGLSHLPEAHLEEANIVPMIKEICREYKNTTLLESSEVKLKIDIVLFKEILRNLIKNAAESGESISVEVGILQGGNKTTVFVKDNGRGIKSETLSKIFEPGFSTKKGSIGIGLCIVKSLAEEQSARIEVESEEGKGSCFRVVFDK